MDRIQIANLVVSMLVREGMHEDAAAHIWDRLVDGLAKDTKQELAALYGMLQPHDASLIFIRDGRVSSPKEPGAIAYRKV
jgi:hypothetical protein